MQILQVSKYYFPHIGGVEKHLLSINQEFLKTGHSITVLTQSQEKLPSQEIKNQVNIERIYTDHLEKSFPWRYKVKIWSQVIKHYQLFKKADIIHIHDVFWWLLPIYPFIRKKTFHYFSRLSS